MGCGQVKDCIRPQDTESFRPIPDQYRNISQVQAAVRRAGLESSNLIVGVDFTKSNTWNGAETFNGKSLHKISPRRRNPYEEVISIMGRTLEDFDDDRLISAFGFGDATTGDKQCFPFHAGGRPSYGVDEVLKRYAELAGTVRLAGPTSFAPVIREAIRIVCEEQSYHILVIIADGQVTDDSPRGETARAIIEASNYPLSIVVVGVGDGPWHAMEHYDDELPERRFDNFQFVDFNQVANKTGERRDAAFALNALMEVPDQYSFIKKAGMLAGTRRPPSVTPPPLAPSPPTQLAPHTQRATPPTSPHLACASNTPDIFNCSSAQPSAPLPPPPAYAAVVVHAPPAAE